MKNVLLIAMVALLSACASTPRTKWTDKTMRVMIDPASVSAGDHVRIQQALIASGKWVVVDRADGLRAIKKEQESLHRNESDRFMDKEKWAHWGKLYGVGGVVIGKSQCTEKQTWFVGQKYSHCLQNLAIVDANTGEVITAIENVSEGEAGETSIANSWVESVAKLNDSYPKNYVPSKDSQILNDYRELSKEEAVRQKEELARQPSNEEGN